VDRVDQAVPLSAPLHRESFAGLQKKHRCRCRVKIGETETNASNGLERLSSEEPRGHIPGSPWTLNILVSSRAFAPSLGGIETVSALLAEEFVKADHSVVIVTQSAGTSDRTEFGAPIVRGASPRQLRQLVKWCDVFWHNNLSIRATWPGLLLGKPLVVTHSGSYCRRPMGLDAVLRLKHAIVNRVTSVAISRYVASFFKTRSIIIPNPYDAYVFQARLPQSERKREFVFLGRLVEEKGLDILLEALSRLRRRDLRPQLTVVGSGPELEKMRELTRRLGLEAQVQFQGARTGSELASTLNQHQTLVVPSRYDEPFGVVALEGIACGCAVIASSGGGLPEAIGPCGITFPNGDIAALEQALERLSTRPDERERLTAQSAEHLLQFQPRLVAERYLELFQTVAL
jgi:glycogen synthase